MVESSHKVPRKRSRMPKFGFYGSGGGLGRVKRATGGILTYRS